MFATITRNRTIAGGISAVSEAVKGHVPDVTQVKGFVAYHVVAIGPSDWVTVGIFENEASALKWNEICETQFGESRVGELLSRDPKYTGFASGEVIFTKMANKRP